MSKQGNHKQSLPESADPGTWPNIIDPQSWPNIIDFQSWPNIEGNWPSQWLVNSASADPELEAILEADRLALEQVLEAADPGLREALEAERLRLERLLTGT